MKKYVVLIAAALLLFLVSCKTVGSVTEEDSKDLEVAGTIGELSGGVDAASGMGDAVEGNLEDAVASQEDIASGVASAVSGALSEAEAGALIKKVQDQSVRLASALATTKLLNGQMDAARGALKKLSTQYLEVVRSKDAKISELSVVLSEMSGELGLVRKWLIICASILAVVAVAATVKIIRRFV